jgi:hypothetical protein
MHTRQFECTATKRFRRRKDSLVCALRARVQKDALPCTRDSLSAMQQKGSGGGERFVQKSARRQLGNRAFGAAIRFGSDKA